MTTHHFQALLEFQTSYIQQYKRKIPLSFFFLTSDMTQVYLQANTHRHDTPATL